MKLFISEGCDDLLSLIFNFIPIGDVYHIVRRVCKDWNKIVVKDNFLTIYGSTQFESCVKNSCGRFGFIPTVISSSTRIIDKEQVDLHPIWDSKHCEFIFKICFERNSKVTDFYSLPAINSCEIKEGENAIVMNLVNNIQFIYSSYYDLVLMKRILNNSSLEPLIGIENGHLGKFRERLNGNEQFLEIASSANILIGGSDELFLYKLFERVFTLDQRRDWTATFPAIEKSKIHLIEFPTDRINQIFELELEMALELVHGMISIPLRRNINDLMLKFACYCRDKHHRNLEIVKKSEIIIKKMYQEVYQS